MRHALAVVLTVALMAPSAAAGEPPAQAELDALLGDRWYGVYFSGTKSGCYHLTLSRGGTAAAPTYTLRGDFRFEAVAMGNKVVTTTTEEKVFDGRSPYALRSSITTTSQGGREERRVERAGRGYRLSVKARGEATTFERPDLRHGLGDELAVQLWIRKRPAVEAQLDHTTLDEGEGTAEKARAIVMRVDTRQVDGVEARIYRLVQGRPIDEAARAQRREADAAAEAAGGASRGEAKSAPPSQSVYDEAGQLLVFHYSETVEMRLEPAEVAQRLEASGDLFVDGMARLDRPLGEPRRLLVVKLKVEGEAAAHVPGGPFQSVRTTSTGRIELTMDVRHGPKVAATPDELARYVRATPEVPATHPDVVKLAENGVKGARTLAEKVERLVHFVAFYVEDAYGANAASVLDIIRRRKGDCTEHAALFTTLARALGIPARTVGGLVYMGDEQKAFGGHAWNEVVLDGVWIPVDACWDEPRANPGHIRLHADGDDEANADSTTYGRLRFGLISAE